MAEENQEMSYEEAMQLWQYMLLTEDWKRLTRVIASIAALLQTANEAIMAKSDEEKQHPAYQECAETLQAILGSVVLPRWGSIRSAYNALIGGQKAFSQYSLAVMRKENLQLKSEIVGLKAHIESLEKELENMFKEKQNGND